MNFLQKNFIRNLFSRLEDEDEDAYAIFIDGHELKVPEALDPSSKEKENERIETKDSSMDR